jgi:hypothetical protein
MLKGKIKYWPTPQVESSLLVSGDTDPVTIGTYTQGKDKGKAIRNMKLVLTKTPSPGTKS